MTAALPDVLADAKPVELAIAKLDLRSGDLVAIRTDIALTAPQSAALSEFFESAFPGVKVIVLDRSADLTVVRRDAEPILP